MSWREIIKARPASFRGVHFFVNTSERTGGRRDVKHEYPQRDFPFFEDLGRVTTGFVVNGHVLGDDYLESRDQLIEALEDSDSIGTLQHPYYGILRVKPRGFTVSESSQEGGIAVFSMNFEEAEEAEQVPIVLESIVEELAEKASAVAVSLEESFPDQFSVDGFPGFFVEEAGGWVETLSEAYEDGMQYLAQAEEFAQDTASYIRKVQNLATQAVAFVNDPLSLVRELTSIYDDVLRISEDADNLFSYFESLFSYGDDFLEYPETTTTRKKQKTNRGLLVDAVKALSIANAARAAGAKNYESDAAASADRDLLLDEIEEIIVATEDDSLFRDLTNLKYSITKLTSTTQVQLLTINAPVTIPELALSWKLYGDAEQPIAERNSFVHPGFLLGDLEVLSSV